MYINVAKKIYLKNPLNPIDLLVSYICFPIFTGHKKESF